LTICQSSHTAAQSEQHCVSYEGKPPTNDTYSSDQWLGMRPMYSEDIPWYLKQKFLGQGFQKICNLHGYETSHYHQKPSGPSTK